MRLAADVKGVEPKVFTVLGELVPYKGADTFLADTFSLIFALCACAASPKEHVFALVFLNTEARKTQREAAKHIRKNVTSFIKQSS